MGTNKSVRGEDYSQFVVGLREQIDILLRPVKECADAVDRINELVGLRDQQQRALPNLNLKLSPEETEQVTRRKQQIDDYQKEIDLLCKPFWVPNEKSTFFWLSFKAF